VQRLIQYRFVDIDLLLLSLTHRSIARTAGVHQPSNERLEFLGDSVLGLIIAAALFHDQPEASEGDLTKQKAMLVNEVSLSQVAIEIGLNKYIRMSPEEERSGGRERPSIVSDAFEAVIGALFLAGGFETARRLVIETIYRRKDVLIADTAQQNYKGDLLELIQGRGNGMPCYEILSEFGPDHDKTFHVSVSVNGARLGEGAGSSKKEAEQRAACAALRALREPQ
jgi:ribonuclease-3